MRIIKNGQTAEAQSKIVDQMRYCTACGQQNPSDVAVCLNCKAALGLVCTSCNQTASAGSKFCTQCGAQLPKASTSSDNPPARQKQPPGLHSQITPERRRKIGRTSAKALGERREVTVLFLSVANFSTATEAMDEAEVYRFIDEVLSLLADVVFNYEGTVDKFTSAGLMALFGAPEAHENDPERAIRAALDMQQAIAPVQRRIKQVHNFDFQIRIGLNTGPVVAGKIGNNAHMEYTVIGDTVNLASRLETAAEPGTILVSAETYQRTKSLFEFTALPPFTVKGMPQPVTAFQPLRLREDPDQVEGIPGFDISMIGRTEELAQLQKALETILHSNQRQIALISGEAGVGKSRLVTEFRQTLTQAEVKVYQGNCLAYARSTPLRVVAEILRNILHFSANDSVQAQQQALQSYLDRLALDYDEISPYLRHVLGLTESDAEVEAHLSRLDATVLQQQTHLAIRQVLLAEATLGPTVLIFEDLHWVDPASKDFLQYLIETTSDVPLLMVLVSRQAERKSVLGSLLIAAEKDPNALIDLALSSLSSTEGQLLVDQLIAQTTSDAWTVKKTIIERAAGNPLYVEEIIRMLLDQGGLIQEMGSETKAQVTADAKELLRGVPDTVKGLILARFDRLPEGLRRVLHQASVLGASFPLSLLEQLNNVSPKVLAVQLQELETRQFITARPFQSKPGYIFRHALLQETIYSTLLKRDRRQIHTRVAQAIEKSELWRPEEQTEALAYHYARSTSPTQAIPYLVTAAENAERRSAFEGAVEHYRQVLDILPDWPGEQNEQFFQIRVGLGRSLNIVGEQAAAEKILLEILEPVRSLAADSETYWPILIENLRQLADIRQKQGNYDEALIHLQAGLDLLGPKAPQEEPKLWRALIDRMSWIYYRQGRLEDASTLLTRATRGESVADSNDPIMLGRLYNALGLIYWQQGQLDAAIMAVEQSIELYKRIGYSWGIAIAYGNLAIYYDVQGEWTRAIGFYEQAYDLQLTTGSLQHQAINLDNLGLLHLRMGNHDRARHELTAALSISRRLGDAWETANAYLNLAQLALSQSHFEEAGVHAEAALSLGDKTKSIDIQVEARWILAQIQAERGELAQGIQSAEQALEMAEKAGLIEKKIETLRVLGILRTQNAEYNQAKALLQDSIDLALRKNDPYRYGQALLALGRMYQQQAQSAPSHRAQWQATAIAYLSEAIDQFEALGATHSIGLAQTALDQIQKKA